ncbi:hypothetical protein [Peribacillus simplex]
MKKGEFKRMLVVATGAIFPRILSAK